MWVTVIMSRYDAVIIEETLTASNIGTSQNNVPTP